LQDGGTYTVAVEGVTSGTCSFSGTQDADGVGAALSFVYSPANDVVASDAVYTFMRLGTKVYVSWTTFQ
jgi:hypothetical protein